MNKIILRKVSIILIKIILVLLVFLSGVMLKIVGWALFHMPFLFTSLIAMSIALVCIFKSLKRARLTYFCYGVIIALFFHQIESINIQRKICKENPLSCLYDKKYL